MMRADGRNAKAPAWVAREGFDIMARKEIDMSRGASGYCFHAPV
jgi:hypothetical protein